MGSEAILIHAISLCASAAHRIIFSMALPRPAMKKAAGAMKTMKAAMKAKVMKKTKAMKKVKVMKAMKKAMKKSVIAKGKMAKAMVLRGSKEQTSGGLKKDSLRKNKGGKIVSKKASDRAKKNYAGSALQKWAKACQAARKELGLKGFQLVGGKTAQGRALYAKTKALYRA